MFFKVAFGVVSCLISLASAGPIKITTCDVSSLALPIPAGQPALVVPPGEKLKYVALGVGVQNYTCSTTGTYTSAGAVAELIDISCLATKPSFSNIQNLAFTLFNAAKRVTAQQIIDALGTRSIVLGQHFFITNPNTGSGISPDFDFRAASQQGNPTAFVVAAKVGGIPAPTGSQDVDWLELASAGAGGQLATHVFRLRTKSGQPPASCTPGSSPISVKYAAQYYFYAN